MRHRKSKFPVREGPASLPSIHHMTTILRSLLLTLAFAFPWPALAATQQIPAQTSIKTQSGTVGATSDAAGEAHSVVEATRQDEIKLLKAELQIVEGYQDKILSTVYWSLGTLAAIAVLLVGFGWFANFRVYERDKKALSQELHTSIVGELQRVEKTVTDGIETAKSTLPELVKREVQQRVQTIQTKIDSALASMASDISTLKLDVAEAEHDRWVRQGVLSNALRVSTQMLQVSKGMDPDWFVSRALDQIQSDLKAILSKPDGVAPDAGDISALTSCLADIGPSHTIAVASINSLLAKVRQAT